MPLRAGLPPPGLPGLHGSSRPRCLCRTPLQTRSRRSLGLGRRGHRGPPDPKKELLPQPEKARELLSETKPSGILSHEEKHGAKAIGFILEMKRPPRSKGPARCSFPWPPSKGAPSPRSISRANSAIKSPAGRERSAYLGFTFLVAGKLAGCKRRKKEFVWQPASALFSKAPEGRLDAAGQEVAVSSPRRQRLERPGAFVRQRFPKEYDQPCWTPERKGPTVPPSGLGEGSRGLHPRALSPGQLHCHCTGALQPCPREGYGSQGH